MTYLNQIILLLIITSFIYCKTEPAPTIETSTFKNFAPNAEDDYIFNPKKDKMVIDVVQNDSSIEGDLITICGTIEKVKGVVKFSKKKGSKILLSNLKQKEDFILKYHICDEENDSDVGYIYGIYN